MKEGEAAHHSQDQVRGRHQAKGRTKKASSSEDVVEADFRRL